MRTRRRAGSPAEEAAFLRSVLYAAVFDYPLTIEQLHEALIGVAATPADLARWYDESYTLQQVIEFSDGYFFPRGRRDLLDLRHAREVISRSVLKELRQPLSLVLRMPFVRMVALSGSLAHLNAGGEADLDLFVITKANRVWSVTTTLLVLARVFGWRRRLCLNYVISETHLAVEPDDLFSANQIVHLRPLSGEDVYQRFIAANPFVHRLYPNFSPRPLQPAGGPSTTLGAGGAQGPGLGVSGSRRRLEAALDWTVAPLVERFCRAAYGWHLRRRAPSWQSHDQVRLEPQCLKLHTSSHRQSVMERFEIAVAEAERVTLEAAAHAQGVL
jgi:hypothetical protein